MARRFIRYGPQPGAQPTPIVFVVIFALTMSAVFAAMGAVVRWPMGGPPALVFLKAFFLLSAAVSAATLALSRVERRGASHVAVLMCPLVVLFLPCLAWLMGRTAEFVVDPVLIVLFVAGILHVVTAGRRMPVGRTLPVFGCGVLAGLGYFLLVNAQGYTNVLSPEQALVGTSNLDTLFHASIANMLVKHGELSTGLDGFVPLKYHFLSHIWLGCVGLWLGTDTLTAYFVGAQVVAIPMLFFSLSLGTHALRPAGQGLNGGALVVLFPLLLLVLTEITGPTSYLVSESYFLAIIIYLLALPSLAEISRTGRGRRLGLLAACLAVATILMGLSKVSVGAVFAVPFAYLLLRQWCRTLLTFLKLMLSLLFVAALAGVIIFRGLGGTAQMLAPLSFARDYPDMAWLHVASNAVLVLGAIAVWCVGTSSERKSAEAFALIAVTATMPALILSTAGGAAYYFVNVGTFAAIVFVSAYGGPWLYGLAPKLFRPEPIVVAILLVTLGTDQKTGSPFAFADEFAELQLRARGYLGDGPSPNPVAWRRVRTLLIPGGAGRRALASDVKRLARGQSIQRLSEAGVTRTPGAAVFIPPDLAVYWSAYRDCRAASLVVPAVLGVPMVRGFNPECSKDPNYGFSAYASDAVSQPSSDSELCERVATWGLKAIFVLASSVRVRKIACGQ